VRVPPVLVVGRQPVHAVPLQNALHRGAGHRHPVKTFEIGGNLAGPEVVVLPEIQDLADDISRRRPRRVARRPSSIRQPGITVLARPLPPLVERLP